MSKLNLQNIDTQEFVPSCTSAGSSLLGAMKRMSMTGAMALAVGLAVAEPAPGAMDPSRIRIASGSYRQKKPSSLAGWTESLDERSDLRVEFKVRYTCRLASCFAFFFGSRLGLAATPLDSRATTFFHGGGYISPLLQSLNAGAYCLAQRPT